MSNEIARTTAELEEDLEEQLSFLDRSAAAFDNGNTEEAKRLAATLRVLLHDSGRSKSLLGQLDRKDVEFVDTALPINAANMAAQAALCDTIHDPMGWRYIAPLDLRTTTRRLSFDDWWRQVVFLDQERNELTREQLVLSVAEKDGGVHVDPKLTPIYGKLSRQNSMGFHMVNEPSGDRPIDAPHLAAVRQIAHEVLKTLRPEYQYYPRITGSVFRGLEVTIIEGSTASTKPQPTERLSPPLDHLPPAGGDFSMLLTPLHPGARAGGQSVDNSASARAAARIGISREAVDAAVKRLKQDRSLNRTELENATNLGVAFAQSGSIERAVSVWKRIIAIDPGFAAAYHNLGIAYRYLGAAHEQQRMLAMAARLDPKNPEPHFWLGLTLAEHGDVGAARPYFERAAKLAPADSRNRYALARAYALTNSCSSAVAELAAAVRIDPGLRLSIRSDPVFLSLRNRPDFIEIAKEES